MADTKPPAKRTQQDELQERLVKIHRDAEERDAERRAALLKVKYVDLRKVPIQADAVALIPEAAARSAKAVAIELSVRDVALAAVDPKSAAVEEIVKKLEGQKYLPKVFIATPSGIEEAFRFYRFVAGEAKDLTGKVEIARVEELLKEMKGLPQAQAEIARLDFHKVSTTNLFEIVLAGALATRASDVHFEAEEEGARLRYRIDGLLHDVYSPLPLHNYDQVISRIKLLSGLKINIHGEPQDGRFTIELSKKEIEMRVSIIPSEFGETIVMRILDPDAINVDLHGLGLRDDDYEVVIKELARPNGLILNTGPTGSGKTTTLYAFLRHLVNPEVKIITVEDPIEYRVDGIEQTQTNPDVGYTFAGGLRAILRQDPDVILIGEIRDLETADIALQASLTGHIVLSTLHTNDAVGAVPRLVDLGVKPQTIGPALTLVIAQRLVRRLCNECKKPIALPADHQAAIDKFLSGLPPRIAREPYAHPTFYSPVGCESCSNLGYRGRIGIYEFFRGGPELEEMVLKDSSAHALHGLAARQEMVTMQDDGVLKIMTGMTSFEEVVGITGEIPWLPGVGVKK